MAMNVTPFVGTDNFNMETFNNMISQINNGVNSEISEVLAQLGTKAKIQTGSYVGTGTYGADNPCSLTFDEIPKIIFIITLTDERYLAMPFSPLVSEFNTIYLAGSGSRTCTNKLSVSGNTISWYLNYAPDSHAYAQMNYSGNTYYYFAFS